ncbi:hypothetical protein SSX86_022867 [Deinandra increscens subsp. villosa]|uniref:FAS1 domain-containing protein n=1 Tax=Deinandra increscens subsp. villosa TaxID=3103831 RepID=A0AAP0CQ00_9ASTR
MPKHLFPFLFVLFTTTTAAAANSSSPAPSPSISPPVPNLPPPPPLPPAPGYMQQQQLKNIIDALIGAGDFAAWANILFNPISNNSSSIPTSTLIPTTATMFVPGNDALSHISGAATGAYSFDPFIIPYHVLPQRLTFSDLQLFRTLTRIPTLLPSKTVVITDNAPAHFTIDDSLITQPDIYSNDAVCVHGIANILDYKAYGQTPPTVLPPPPLPPADETTLSPPPEVTVSSMGVVVSCLDFLIPFVFLVYMRLVS